MPATRPVIEGRRVARKGGKGRFEKEGQGGAMEERERKEEAGSEERGLVELKAPGLFSLSQGHILGACEPRSPTTAVLPECCCLSRGRRRGGGQTFIDEGRL